MATQRSPRTAGHSTTMGMIGAAALLTAALIGSLLITMSPSAIQAPAPAAPVAAPAVAAPPEYVSYESRFFADEVAGAAAQYIDAASLAGPLPERLQDLAQPAAPPVAEPLVQPSQHNRFFADEIATGAGVAHDMALDPPSVLHLNGPR